LRGGEFGLAKSDEVGGLLVPNPAKPLCSLGVLVGEIKRLPKVFG